MLLLSTYSLGYNSIHYNQQELRLHWSEQLAVETTTVKSKRRNRDATSKVIEVSQAVGHKKTDFRQGNYFGSYTND